MIGVPNVLMKMRVWKLGEGIGHMIGVEIGLMNRGLMMHGLLRIRADNI